LGSGLGWDIIPKMKIIASFLFLVLCLALFAPGCRKSPDARVPRIRILENAVPGGINSEIYDWYQEQIPRIEQELGIKIELAPAGVSGENYKARVALDLEGGWAADIIGIDQSWMPEFAEAGLLLPINDFLITWPDRTQYDDSMIKMGSFRGRTYLVMRQTDLRMLFYHKEILSRAGVPVPWQPQNWEDLLDAARKIKNKFPAITPLQINAGAEMGEATTTDGFLILLYAAGGELYDENLDKWVADSPAYRESLNFYRRIYVYEGLASARLVTSAKAREKSYELFSKGKIAIYLESTGFYNSVLKPGGVWGVLDRDKRIGWARMPGSGASYAPRFISLSQGNGLVINPRSKDPYLAWQVMEELNTLPGLEKLFEKQPLTPARKDLAQSEVFKQNRFISETALALLPYTRSRPGLPEYPEVSFLIQLMTEEVILGRSSPEEALAKFRGELERVVGEENVIRKPGSQEF